MLNEITDYTKCGKCSQCGECCSGLLPVTDNEIKLIKKYIKEHEIKEIICNYPLAGEITDMTCPFRDNATKKCNIYEARPKICKIFICNKPVNHTLLADNIKDIKRYRPFEMRNFFVEEDL